jgi:hypothetical protein
MNAPYFTSFSYLIWRLVVLFCRNLWAAVIKQIKQIKLQKASLFYNNVNKIVIYEYGQAIWSLKWNWDQIFENLRHVLAQLFSHAVANFTNILRAAYVQKFFQKKFKAKL